jgi:glycosyltransferase involved in cell wall biosynthesis
MKVSGFTFIRNALQFDFPIVEAIRSILPICDEVVVAAGNSSDDTLGLIESIGSPKIRIIQTVWDDSLRAGGEVLAQETNKALAEVAADADWCFYIQGDEVLHEQYLPVVKEAMLQHLDNPQVEGLLFDYLHFWGSYRYVGDSARWYRNEIRVIRNQKNIISYKDAQGFRTIENQKLHVKRIAACMYHYGYVKSPDVQRQKLKEVAHFWYDGANIENFRKKLADFDYQTEIDSLALFEGTHPAVMQSRLSRYNWDFGYELSKKNFKIKYLLKYWVEKITGWRIGEYRNFIEI